MKNKDLIESEIGNDDVAIVRRDADPMRVRLGLDSGIDAVADVLNE